jgi:hypothetical protein
LKTSHANVVINNEEKNHYMSVISINLGAQFITSGFYTITQLTYSETIDLNYMQQKEKKPLISMVHFLQL